MAARFDLKNGVIRGSDAAAVTLAADQLLAAQHFATSGSSVDGLFALPFRQVWGRRFE
jgi:hypothetical protein